MYTMIVWSLLNFFLWKIYKMNVRNKKAESKIDVSMIIQSKNKYL